MEFNIWQMGAGIGILLYGMHNFEQALNYLGGKKLKQLLQNQTKTARKAIWTGAWTTTVLQSSTLVSLLVLAFTGAGIMQLQNAIGVILGANIGSPMLPLFAALIGFNEFDIGSLAYPLIAGGALILMFIKNEKRLRYAKLIIGFGLFFVGIGMMKESVDALKASFDIESFAHLSLWGFGLLGAVFSALMSSSGALGIITIAAVGGGIITFPASVAIMIGANIGTTWTAFLASLGGNKVKRQVAMSHVLFNVLSTVFGVVYFRQYIWVGNELFGLADNPALSNAVIAVVYNVTTCLIFGVFIQPFTKLVIRCVPEKKDQELRLHIASLANVSTNASFTSPQLLALAEDCKILVDQTNRYSGYIFGITPELTSQTAFDPDSIDKKLLTKRDKQEHIKLYEQAKNTANEMLELVLQLKQVKLSVEGTEQLHSIEHTVTSCLRTIKAIKNIRRDILDFADATDTFTAPLYEEMLENQLNVRRHLYHVQSAPANYKYEELLLAHKEFIQFHHIFVSHITSIPEKNVTTDLPITTLIDIDRYIYEAMKASIDAHAHTYLTPVEADNYEDTESVDEEKQ